MTIKNSEAGKDIFRDKIHTIMEPDYSNASSRLHMAGVWFNIFIMVCIVISCVLIPIDIFWPEHGYLWWKMEVFFAVIFVIEYLLRWYSAENRFKYPFSFYAIIDLIAILPFLFMVSEKFMIFRMFRGIRILRILKILRYNHLVYQALVIIKTRYAALKDEYQFDRLAKLFSVTFVVILVGSNLLYFTEREFADNAGPYSSYFKSYWDSIVILFSGLEDKEPLSFLGKLEVGVLLIIGLCLVGMLTAEIVSILIRQMDRKGKVKFKPYRSRLENHIVILGNNSHLDYIIRQVYEAFNGLYYILVVCKNAEDIRISIPEIYKKVMAINGDPLSPVVLHHANLDTALRAIVLSDGRRTDSFAELDNLSLMKSLAVVSRNPDLPVTVEIQDRNSLKYTRTFGNTEFIVSRLYLEKLLGQAVLNPGITAIYQSLMIFSDDTNEFYKVIVRDDFPAKTFNEAQLHFLNNAEAIVPVGIMESGSKNHCILNPCHSEDDIELEPGDTLIVMAYSDPLYSKDSAGLMYGIMHGDHVTSSINEKMDSDNPSCKYFKGLDNNTSFSSLRSDSVIICNCNPNVKQIVEELLGRESEKKLDITLIVQDVELWWKHPEWHPDPSLENFSTVEGDPADIETLMKAGVKNCGAALILADPLYEGLADGPSILIAMAIESINSEIHTIMEIINSVNQEYIDTSIIDEVVCLGDISEKLIAQNCFFPGVKNIFHNLLTTGKDTPHIILPPLEADFCGMRYRDIVEAKISKGAREIVCGFIRDNDYVLNPKSGKEPGKDTVLNKGNQLIVITHP